MLSACFVSDLARTIDGVCANAGAIPYAVYTPAGTEEALRALLPAGFRLLAQCDGDLGARLFRATADLLQEGHAAAILINGDSPTLPGSIIEAAIDAVRRDDVVVLSRALDGGYTLIGLSRPHAHIFADIPWSTPQVHRLTMQRAAEIGLAVVNVSGWYDVDDADTLRLLEAELAGGRLPHPLPNIRGAEAPATRRFLADRSVPLREAASW